MTRYWLPVLVLVLIVSSVGTYYIRGTASHLPQFVLVPQQGEAKEAEGVTIRGMYSYPRISPAVTIGLKGSKYVSEQSLLESMEPYSWSSGEIRQLAKNHRQFMRGKRADQAFYQDDRLLVYVGLKEDRAYGAWRYWFEVSILDKQEQQTTKYEVSISDLNMYAFYHIEDVQVIGEELAILMNGYRSSGEEREYRRYNLGISDGAMLSSEAVSFPGQTSENVRKVYESNVTKAAQYYVFYTLADEGYVPAQLMRYELRTGEMETLQSPVIDEFLEFQSSDDYVNMTTDGDILYMTLYGEQEVRVLEYNLADDQVVIRPFEVKGAKLSYIDRDRMYLLSQADPASPASFIIVQLSSGELLFEGTIEGKSAKHADQIQGLEFYGFAIQG
ncbi:hypothetical protein DUZ99_17990 [Xylanibacillus composti]|uniref:Uncharacterized protein n=1 Tax=Xylanibacillus composti TaxID=1572762 RepID=A0A8J4H7T4_9BACL|nr:hypothetical protein [Xylanibacillus composti]MDT9726872.1 hypothetical protein [Xylanibacillus composti]GIQ71356.1 hypothetical protein XYCOK13_41800 [Xylanibacillus composti]